MPISAADLQVVLATTRELSRGPACRLALDVERWIDVAARQIPERASELGVPASALRVAAALRAGASAVAAERRSEARQAGARLVSRLDPEYPADLHDLELPPPALWVRGRIPPGPRISIVGSRRMSWYGRQVAQTFARQFAARGVPVVSGFARGVDSTAHEAALEPPGGRTVAILGCGVDIDYPRGSRRRAAAIAEAGALVSELPPGVEPRAQFFPRRNRLIAALGASTLVIQAALRSGSLVTARHALELGRDVWAVPGEILDASAQGTNALIADGALVARHPEDLLEGLAFRGLEITPSDTAEDDGTAGGATEIDASGRPRPARGRREGPAVRLLEVLREEGSSTAEVLASACGLGLEKLLALLLELELDGAVRREPGPRWRV